MRQHPLRNMLIVMGLAVGLLILTIVLGRSPTLGLDLQGGVSVNLQPVDESGAVVDDIPDEQLDEAIGIIRNRVDAVGVTEPEVSRQGNTITVQLPGASNQQDVIDLVGTTARLRFRPVLQVLGPELDEEQRSEVEAEVERLRGEAGMPEGVTTRQVVEEEVAAATAAAEADPEAAPPEGPQNQWGVDVNSESFQGLVQAETLLESQVTPREEIERDQEVTLADGEGNLYRLGPTYSSGDNWLEGEAVEDATSGLDPQGQWTVTPTFREGPEGIDLFNQIAALCNAGDPSTCPAQPGGLGQLAIVLDGEVLTAPSIQQPSFSRDQIQISGAFTQDSARDVAVALRYGSLPLELVPQQAETVSATLGEGALRAGIISGLIGLLAVFVYLFAYYRMLALITLASLSTSAMLLWSAMSWLGATVTLAGVVGLVVSIGVAIDSSVVSFEGIKEDVRKGATVRSVAERSMTRSYSTIVKADTSSLIGAAVLYWLSIGPVRGFAFYLGAATLLDLFSAFFVLRPGVMSLSRSGAGKAPGRLGVPIDDLPEETRTKVTGGAAAAEVGA
ncbi:MAG: protein translocase subunit SecD [Actinomycetia bacterium]|nr:protein translocase subunit SecD [Actinomycetes bacterium]